MTQYLVNTTPVDVAIENHGSITMLRPLTEKGRAWLKNNTSFSPWQWFYGALACEPRLVPGVVAGMADTGLICQDAERSEP